jgi:hypothetical protein
MIFPFKVTITRFAFCSMVGSALIILVFEKYSLRALSRRHPQRLTGQPARGAQSLGTAALGADFFHHRFGFGGGAAVMHQHLSTLFGEKAEALANQRQYQQLWALILRPFQVMPANAGIHDFLSTSRPEAVSQNPNWLV